MNRLRPVLIRVIIFLFFIFPVYCLVLLSQSGPLDKYILYLPNFSNAQAMAQGVYLIWPAAVLALWALFRNPLVQRFFSAIVSKQSVATGWKFCIVLLAYDLLVFFIPLPLKRIWAPFLAIPLLGVAGGWLAEQKVNSIACVIKFGWAIYWRLIGINLLLSIFYAVTNLTLIYISLAPALGLIHEVAEYKSFSDFLRQLDAAGPFIASNIKFFTGCDLAILLLYVSGWPVLASLFVPGLAFRLAGKKLENA